MDETENYLNSILQKRIGSVVNQSAFTKNGHTVARLPQQEEKIESMPTVFRKKYETVYHNTQNPSYVDGRTSFVSKKESVVQENQSSEPVGSHRVEYMAISKRIDKKKQGQFISPTIDVTKYRVSNTIVRSKSPLQEKPLKTEPEDAPSLYKIKSKQEASKIQEVVQMPINNMIKGKRRRIFQPI